MTQEASNEVDRTAPCPTLSEPAPAGIFYQRAATARSAFVVSPFSVVNYSGSVSPDPPISFGKSLSLGKPSLIFKIVSS